MEERIRKFMELKGISPSELADTIGVQRSNVTHVIKGRNKPSFQFIEKLLTIYPDLNAKWLLLGQGNMIEGKSTHKTLFDSVPESVAQPDRLDTKAESVSNEEITVPLQNNSIEVPPAPLLKEPEKELNTSEITDEKPIERLIVFYKDQTFKVHYPSR